MIKRDDVSGYESDSYLDYLPTRSYSRGSNSRPLSANSSVRGYNVISPTNVPDYVSSSYPSSSSRSFTDGPAASTREQQGSVSRPSGPTPSSGNRAGDGASVSYTSPPVVEEAVTLIPLLDDHKYTIIVYTGEGYFSSTDANVYITMYGENGKSSEFPLKYSADHIDPFQPGQKDTFNLRARDMGAIHKISVRHDNTGLSPTWLLNKIIVVDDVTKEEFVFKHDNWLFKSTSENALEQQLQVHSSSVSFSLDAMTKENHAKHHTDKFKSKSSKLPLILRRGDSFQIRVKLSSAYKEGGDQFFFTLSTSQRPRSYDNTLLLIPRLSQKVYNGLIENQGGWGYVIRDNSDPKDLLVEIHIPSTALVSKYELAVEMSERTVCTYAAPVYILFNPWCEDDEVYMEDEEELREYVFKQHGQVYVGTGERPRPRSWYFGQFEGVSLEAAFKLMEKQKPAGRGSPVTVSRMMSSLVNSNDNNGVVVGNWSGNYTGGKAPGYWSSSPPILQQFVDTSKPVRFGQCWVFSSVLTTVMRTLGIPCRPVTNFSSAHDSEGNCSHDIYLDAEGEKIEGISKDSVWNFHCWNDVWMARDDLPLGYGGWQALDSTPQERSQGLFQMGPASHAAVKEGKIELQYDTSFVLAEVNADVMIMKKNRSDDWVVVQRNQTAIGKSISTKAVNSDERHDLTEEYKFKEGSILERSSVRNALIKSNNAHAKVQPSEINIEIVSGHDAIRVGEDLEMCVRIFNSSHRDLDVNVVFGGEVVRHDSFVKALLNKRKGAVYVRANDNADWKFSMQASQYTPFLEDDAFIKFSVTALVPLTEEIAKEEKIVDILKPDLNLKNLPKQFKAGVRNQFVATFVNPLDVNLTECELYVDGTITENRIAYINLRNVAANGKFEHAVMITPDRNGKPAKKSIVVAFSCKQLGGISETVKVQVVE